MLSNLGVLAYAQRNYAVARSYFERALAIYEQELGPTHPKTVAAHQNLAQVLGENRV